MTGGRKMTPITVALKGAATLKEEVAKIEGKSVNRNIIRILFHYSIFEASVQASKNILYFH